MKNRFNDIMNYLKVDGWILNRFNTNVSYSDVTCEEELLELKYDDEIKANFNQLDRYNFD